MPDPSEEFDPLDYGDHVHDWFSLTYASYLVLPRLVLQEMSPAWQIKFLELIRELDKTHGHAFASDNYTVYLRNQSGQFVHDPLSDYRRGKVPSKPDKG